MSKLEQILHNYKRFYTYTVDNIYSWLGFKMRNRSMVVILYNYIVLTLYYIHYCIIIYCYGGYIFAYTILLNCMLILTKKYHKIKIVIIKLCVFGFLKSQTLTGAHLTGCLSCYFNFVISHINL